MTILILSTICPIKTHLINKKGTIQFLLLHNPKKLLVSKHENQFACRHTYNCKVIKNTTLTKPREVAQAVAVIFVRLPEQ